MLRHHKQQLRRGITLVELLVVVVIMVILLSAATAAMIPLLADRELREAARQLNAVIGGAPARAAQLGRPVGIWIERSKNNANAAFEVYLAEVPPLYAGDVLGATAIVSPPAGGADSGGANLRYSVAGLGSNPGEGLVQIGDMVRYDYQGPFYPITAMTPPEVIQYYVGDKPPPPTYNNPGVPYQVIRQPRKSSAQPLQMPSSTVVDLSQSGIGGSGTEFQFGPKPVVITFTAQGGIDLVYANWTSGGTWQPRQVTGNIHLLVGSIDKVGANNLADQRNRWVTIGRQSGTVITTENVGGTIDAAREFAISGKGMGGR